MAVWVQHQGTHLLCCLHYWLIDVQSAYNMPSLLPNEWLKLIVRMYTEDDALFQKYSQ